MEPDRYVIIGNHVDAWHFGGVDPSSGTSIVLEIARAIGKKLRSSKYPPHRGIYFLSNLRFVADGGGTVWFFNFRDGK